LLVSAPVLLQGLHEEPPLVDDGARGLGLAVRPPDSVGLRLARDVRELGQQLLRDVFVLLEALLPETTEIEPQHGGGFVLPDVTGDALEREGRFAGALQSLDGDGPRWIGDQGAPDDFQLPTAAMERFAGEGIGVRVRTVGHGDGRRARRGGGGDRRFRRAGRFRRAPRFGRGGCCRGRCRRAGFWLSTGGWRDWPVQWRQR